MSTRLKLDDKQKQAIIRRYERHNSSIRELSQDYHVSYGTVHKLLKEAGVQMRPRGGYHR